MKAYILFLAALLALVGCSAGVDEVSTRDGTDSTQVAGALPETLAGQYELVGKRDLGGGAEVGCYSGGQVLAATDGNLYAVNAAAARATDYPSSSDALSELIQRVPFDRVNDLIAAGLEICGL